jgi:hypothetical protein
MGEYKKALEYSLRSLRIQEAAFGQDSLKSAITMSIIGGILKDQVSG